MVPMYETTNFPSAAQFRSQAALGLRTEQLSLNSVFHDGNLLRRRRCQCRTRCSLNAGVTTTIWSEFRYRNPAIRASARYIDESSFPAPTAASDSGHRSRTSKTKRDRLHRASHQPESPTSNCGELAMTTSGRAVNSPVPAAETQNEL